MTPFSIVVADPPWLFRDALPGRGRGARKHYRCMTVESALITPRRQTGLFGDVIPLAGE